MDAQGEQSNNLLITGRESRSNYAGVSMCILYSNSNKILMDCERY